MEQAARWALRQPNLTQAACRLLPYYSALAGRPPTPSWQPRAAFTHTVSCRCRPYAQPAAGLACASTTQLGKPQLTATGRHSRVSVVVHNDASLLLQHFVRLVGVPVEVVKVALGERPGHAVAAEGAPAENGGLVRGERPLSKPLSVEIRAALLLQSTGKHVGHRCGTAIGAFTGCCSMLCGSCSTAANHSAPHLTATSIHPKTRAARVCTPSRDAAAWDVDYWVDHPGGCLKRGLSKGALRSGRGARPGQGWGGRPRLSEGTPKSAWLLRLPAPTPCGRQLAVPQATSTACTRQRALPLPPSGRPPHLLKPARHCVTGGVAATFEVGKQELLELGGGAGVVGAAARLGGAGADGPR